MNVRELQRLMEQLDRETQALEELTYQLQVEMGLIQPFEDMLKDAPNYKPLQFNGEGGLNV